jgi:hypothetical protein
MSGTTITTTTEKIDQPNLEEVAAAGDGLDITEDYVSELLAPRDEILRTRGRGDPGDLREGLARRTGDQLLATARRGPISSDWTWTGRACRHRHRRRRLPARDPGPPPWDNIT